MSTTQPVRARSNFTLWLVLAVCLAPFVGSLALYHFAPPAQRMNYGELIDVVPLMDEAGMPGELQLLDGKRITLGSLRGKWLMLQRAGGACSGLCGENLWKLRQVRLTQGDNQERIQRVWLVEDDALPPDALLREHEGLLVVMASRSDFGFECSAASSAAVVGSTSSPVASPTTRAAGSGSGDLLSSSSLSVVGPSLMCTASFRVSVVSSSSTS